MLTPAAAIELYIQAKDQHKPALMAQAFDLNAVVRIEAQTEAISFPPVLTGLDRIEQVLVQEFALAWQDVRTFCFTGPGEAPVDAFSCQWMVAMCSRQGEGGRLGYGQYHWAFNGEDGRITGLTIRIDEMMVVPEQETEALVDWAAHLPYPWCPHDALADKPNSNATVVSLLDRLLLSA